jgi:hypothetical protein
MANYQDSSASRESSSPKVHLEGKKGRPRRKMDLSKMKSMENQAMTRTSWKGSRRQTSFGLLLLMTLSTLGVAQGAQATTDCQILIDWLPEMFNSTDTSCCDDDGIKCYAGRITQMYIAKLNRF